jgi:hypothetical protein
MVNGVALHIIVIWVRNEQVIYYGFVFFESLYIQHEHHRQYTSSMEYYASENHW